MCKFCVVESPFAAFTKEDKVLAKVELARNAAYLNACMADSFARDEIPFASHGLYTRFDHGVKVLDDTIPSERKKGIKAGFVLANALQDAAKLAPDKYRFVRAFYADRGWTPGMKEGIADSIDQATEIRFLYLDPEIDPAFWSRLEDVNYWMDSQGVLQKNYWYP